MLVGREQAAPDTGPHAQAANFTNEIAVGGGIRFLKNVAGFWLLEACRASWGSPDVAVLLAEGAAADGAFEPFDTTDPRFLSPDDMEAEIRAAGRHRSRRTARARRPGGDRVDRTHDRGRRP